MTSKAFIFSAFLILPFSLFSQLIVTYDSTKYIVGDSPEIVYKFDFADSLDFRQILKEDDNFNRAYIHYPIDKILDFQDGVTNYAVYFSEDRGTAHKLFSNMDFGDIMYNLGGIGYYTLVVIKNDKPIKIVTYYHNEKEPSGTFTKKFEPHFIDYKNRKNYEKN